MNEEPDPRSIGEGIPFERLRRITRISGWYN